MGKKYEFTNESKIILGDQMREIELHRIKALKSFKKVNEGDLGGWIESEENLSQDGDCWVYDNAKVYDQAQVRGNASIRHNARVREDAIVEGNADVSKFSEIRGYAIVDGHALIDDSVVIDDYAKVGEYAHLTGDSMICGRAKIDGDAIIKDAAWVYEDAHISGSAMVGGCCIVRGDAVISQHMQVNNRSVIRVDLTDKMNIRENLLAQCGLLAVDGKVVCYKQVRKDLSSLYDPMFKYKVGEWVEAENPEISDDSCAPGLHFSSPDYWNKLEPLSECMILVAEVNLDDIITIQDGKIRCKRAFIVDATEL